jgi:HSP20 family protein
MMRELQTRMPTMDLEDLGKEYHLTLEVPGLKKEDIEIQIGDDSVEIRGNKSSRHDEKTKGYVQRERSSESFYRTVALPEEIKTDDARACLNDGLLEITLPKKVPKTKKKLSVK